MTMSPVIEVGGLVSSRRDSPGMHLRMRQSETPRYGCPVKFIDLEQEHLPNRTTINRFVLTFNVVRPAVQKRLELYDHNVVVFFRQNTLWSVENFARKSYKDRTEMCRLWIPRLCPYRSNVEFVLRVPGYKRPGDNMLKVFVVWIHRRRNQLPVEVDIHNEQEGPFRVFTITDYDPDADVSNDNVGQR